MRVRWIVVLSVVALAAAGGAEAAPETQSFALPGRGSLDLAVPPGWTAARGTVADPHGGGDLAAIRVRPGAGSAQEASSRSPGAAEWSHVTRCGVTVGGLLLGVTILDDGKDGSGRRAALDMVRIARHAKPPPADGEYRRAGAGLACISSEKPVVGAPSGVPCLRIGPMRLGLSMAEVAKRLGQPERELKQGAAIVRVYRIQSDAAEVPYWVVTFTQGQVTAIQLTGREAGSLAFSSIRLGDPAGRVRELLGDPPATDEIQEIGGTRWSYRPHPFSLELVDGRVYSIRVHRP